MNEESKLDSQGRDPPYVAVLVRCWREGEQLRFVLENVATRTIHGYTSFEALAEELEAVLLEIDRK